METITIKRKEYIRLKKLDKCVGGFVAYLEHLVDIKEAREEIEREKTVSQEALFKKLGI